MSKSVPPMFSSNSFIVFSLTFWSLIHFETLPKLLIISTILSAKGPSAKGQMSRKQIWSSPLTPDIAPEFWAGLLLPHHHGHGLVKKRVKAPKQSPSRPCTSTSPALPLTHSSLTKGLTPTLTPTQLLSVL